MIRLPTDLSRLDDARRLAVLRGGLLDYDLDPLLQRVLEALAMALEFPTAVISLVMRETQFFRAHVGLPPDLAAMRATDRCSSFCQFVVAEDRPMAIVDSHLEPSLPRDLIELYGTRAYFGSPVHADGQVVGSLCVTDVRPRQLDPAQRELIAQAAACASLRLHELVAHAPPGSEGDLLDLLFTETLPPLRLAEAFADRRVTEGELVRGSAAIWSLLGENR
jgi:GAF domain-containing protein